MCEFNKRLIQNQQDTETTKRLFSNGLLSLESMLYIVEELEEENRIIHSSCSVFRCEPVVKIGRMQYDDLIFGRLAI